MLTKTKFKPLAVLACLFLVMLALFCIGNTEVSAETYSGDCSKTAEDSVKWSLNTSTGVLNITGTGAMPNYTVDELPWANYKSMIIRIEIGEGVTTVGRCAFYGLKFVTKVTLYDGLTKIGDYAFNGCRNLKDIDIPETVTAIGTDAFGKTGLTDIPAV